MLGATPVFADIDPISGNLSAATVEPLINSRTRAVIAVHVAGWPCELDELVDLTRRHGLSLIEDCAQAHGAEFRGRAVGAWGDIGCFSFCQDKILTTGGEGGLVVTRNADYFKRIWSRKDHGKDQDALNRPHVGLFKWLHESIGTNARLTEMQAAIGRVQLRRLPEWVGSRRRNAVTFDRMLSGISGLRLEIPPDHIRHSYYKYYAFVDASSLRPDWNRDRIGLELQRLGVPCGSGSCCEIYLEKAMHPFAPRERWTVARQLSETSLMLLVHPTLETSHIESMARQIRNVLSLATAESCRAAA
jgi:dTDP-4-amino-4,6-dideoxygalactose transaminase